MIDRETLARAGLGELPALSFRALVAGAARASAPFHTAAVATSSSEGPRVRTVVLRRVEPESRRLMFHTDRRSPKYAELEADPRIEWHLYEAPLKWQLRLRGTATLHTDDALADEQWSRSRDASRACYGATDAPGTPVDDAREYDITQDGRTRFAVVATRVDEIDWLFLRHQGHRRARCKSENGTWHCAWIAP